MSIGNHLISNLISKINYGSRKRLRFIKVGLNSTTLELLNILYTNGVIRSYRVEHDDIYIYYKYYLCQIAVRLTIISKPGNRIYWTLNKLSTKFNNNSFSGFYIISTQKGLHTSDFCLTRGITGGEILIKVSV